MMLLLVKRSLKEKAREKVDRRRVRAEPLLKMTKKRRRRNKKRRLSLLHERTARRVLANLLHPQALPAALEHRQHAAQVSLEQQPFLATEQTQSMI
jgi:hypothetical protein